MDSRKQILSEESKNDDVGNKGVRKQSLSQLKMFKQTSDQKESR